MEAILFRGDELTALQYVCLSDTEWSLRFLCVLHDVQYSNPAPYSMNESEAGCRYLILLPPKGFELFINQMKRVMMDVL